MDADMKSFLYSAAFYHPLSDSVPISIQIYLRQKILLFHPCFHTAYHNADPPLYVNHLGKDFTQSSEIKNGF